MSVPLSRQFLTDPITFAQQINFVSMSGISACQPIFLEEVSGKVFRALEIGEAGLVPLSLADFEVSRPTVLLRHEAGRVASFSSQEKGSLWERLFPLPLCWLDRHFKGELSNLEVRPDPFRTELHSLWEAVRQWDSVLRSRELNVVGLFSAQRHFGFVAQYHRGNCVRVGSTGGLNFVLPKEHFERSASWRIDIESDGAGREFGGISAFVRAISRVCEAPLLKSRDESPSIPVVHL